MADPRATSAALRDAPAAPDATARPPATPKAGVAGRRCTECGGAAVFRPGKDALECKYCGKLDPIEVDPTRVIVELDYDTARTTAPMGPAAELAQGGREVECKNCGARTIATGQATRCAFCDAAVVIEIPDDRPQILPQSVLPFRIDHDEAGAQFRAWLKSRWFAPSDLVKRARTEGMDGMYLPYWTYDTFTTTDYRGERGEYYYVTEYYTDSQGKEQSRRVRKTRWYSASGRVDVDFDDVLVCGSRSLPHELVDRLEPWDLPALRPFDDRYLAGFGAERYAVDLEDGFAIACEKMEPPIRAAIRRDIGGDEQRIDWMDVHYRDKRFKHLLLPLWISAFRYRDRVFRVTVNARTGEVSGERPWSWIKITLFVLAILALIIGIYVLAQPQSAPELRRSAPRAAPAAPAGPPVAGPPNGGLASGERTH